MKFIKFSLFLLWISLICLSPAFAEGEKIAKVVRVMDGSILVLEGGQEVRLIGVNAPSIYDDLSAFSEAEKIRKHEMALEVKNFVKYLVEGRMVRFELDPMHGKAYGHKDAEGRILSYAWFTAPVFERPPDWLVIDPSIETGYHDAFLNAVILRAGYAKTDLRWPFQFGEKFLALQNEAENAKRGMWAEHKETMPDADTEDDAADTQDLPSVTG